jgi:Flp pilus assembly protein TadB
VTLPWHFLSTSFGALVVAVVASAVLGFIVWWAVALAVCFLALAAWRLRRRFSPAA